MGFQEQLKKARLKLGYTQQQVADQLGVTKSTYCGYETGKRQPDVQKIKILAQILHTSGDILLETKKLDSCISAEPLLPPKNNRGVKIPVFGNVAAGIPIEAITDIEDYEEIPLEMAETGEYAALRIKGSSMEPRMVKGDVVIVKLQNTIETGETAIILIGDKTTCKKVKKTPEGVWLISTNPIYEPMFFSNKEIEEIPVIIWGKVVELRAKY